MIEFSRRDVMKVALASAVCVAAPMAYLDEPILEYVNGVVMGDGPKPQIVETIGITINPKGILTKTYSYRWLMPDGSLIDLGPHGNLVQEYMVEAWDV